MIRRIMVTGVTRMYGGFVCVTGWDVKAKRFVRPVIEYPDRTGIRKEFLFVDDRPVIKPLNLVELDFIKPVPAPAFHTEDWLIDPDFAPRPVATPDEATRRSFLAMSEDESVNAVLADQSRSVLVVRPRETPTAILRIYEDRLRPRLLFHDRAGDRFNLPVVDANWLAACRFLYLKHGDLGTTTAILQGFLRKSREIFLRIGLTREYRRGGTGVRYPQVSGIFTFPDYLRGRCFADLGYDFDDHV